MALKHAVSWFEISVADYERAKEFYSRIFDTELGEMEAAGSRLALLPSDEDPDAIGGALIQDPHLKPSENGTVVYLNANPDLQVVLDRVVEAGGKVMIEKSPVGPDMGFFAQFKDSEGNRVGLYSTA
jgi:predicted enzyme related to lactoylglutathione lyase